MAKAKTKATENRRPGGRSVKRCSPRKLPATVSAQVLDLIDNGTLGAAAIFRRCHLQGLGVSAGSFRGYVSDHRKGIRRGRWLQNRENRARKRRARRRTPKPSMRGLPPDVVDVIRALVIHGGFGARELYGTLGVARYSVRCESFGRFVRRIREANRSSSKRPMQGSVQRRTAVLIDLILAFLYATESAPIVERVVRQLPEVWKGHGTLKAEHQGVGKR